MIIESYVKIRSWRVQLFIEIDCDFSIIDVFSYRRGKRVKVNHRIKAAVNDEHVNDALDSLVNESQRNYAIIDE